MLKNTICTIGSLEQSVAKQATEMFSNKSEIQLIGIIGKLSYTLPKLAGLDSIVHVLSVPEHRN